MIFKNFEYYNPNPCSKSTGDCVVRALAKATDRTWHSVYDELCNFGRDLGVMPNSDEAYEEFLFHNGFSRGIIPRTKKGHKAMTSEDFCKLYPNGTYILSKANHLQTVKDGKYYDLLPELGAGKVYTYWKKN